MTPAELKWGPAPPALPPGAQIAVLDGDPGKDGFFTLRLKFPDGYKIAPHWHPTDENIVIVSGTFMMGLGEKRNEASMHALAARLVHRSCRRPAATTRRRRAKRWCRSTGRVRSSSTTSIPLTTLQDDEIEPVRSSGSRAGHVIVQDHVDIEPDRTQPWHALEALDQGTVRTASPGRDCRGAGETKRARASALTKSGCSRSGSSHASRSNVVAQKNPESTARANCAAPASVAPEPCVGARDVEDRFGIGIAGRQGVEQRRDTPGASPSAATAGCAGTRAVVAS